MKLRKDSKFLLNGKNKSGIGNKNGRKNVIGRFLSANYSYKCQLRNKIRTDILAKENEKKFRLNS